MNIIIEAKALCRVKIGNDVKVVRTPIKMKGKYYYDVERFGVALLDNSFYEEDVATAEPLFPDEYEIVSATVTYEPENPIPISEIVEVLDFYFIDYTDDIEDEQERED